MRYLSSKNQFGLLIAALALVTIAVSAMLVGTTTLAGKPKMDTPTIECVGNTDHTIFLKVTAGASGTPAGFSIQWVNHADYPNLTCGASGQDALWPSSDGGAICKASFSG